MPYQKDATEKRKTGNVGSHFGSCCASTRPCCAFPRLLATTGQRCVSWRGGKPERPESSLRGCAALAAARGGADRAAHAQLGRGLGLRLRLRLGVRLGCVVIGRHGFHLSVAVSAGVLTPGLGLPLLLTPFQPDTGGEPGHKSVTFTHNALQRAQGGRQ